MTGEWNAWARALIAAIRSVNDQALIFVSGTDWGYDLSGFPLPGEANLVYTTHVYRNKGDQWDRTFGNLAARYPVFAAEWGGEDVDVVWGKRLADYFEAREMGWTAWSWSDWPRLVRAGAPTLLREATRSTEPFLES